MAWFMIKAPHYNQSLVVKPNINLREIIRVDCIYVCHNILDIMFNLLLF